jgi:MFS transporter, FSR family, fosmidomycin resistance protein
MRPDLDRRAMAALSSGHLAVDFASGAVPALLPFLAERFDLSYTATAGVMLAATVSSSLVQPAFGLLSDRRGAMWLLPAGVFLAGTGIAFAGLAPSYALVLVAVFVAGVGIAAYHPEGAKFASYASGHRRASGMALFNIGGNTGYALGPIVITPVVLWLGLSGALLASLPVLVVGATVLFALPYLSTLRPDHRTAVTALGPDRPGAMGILVGVILVRSLTWFGLITFVPLWVISLGHSKADGNRLLSLMLVAGVVGALAVGPVADRFGLRRTLLGTTALLPPLVLVFIHVGGVPGAFALMLVGVCVVGAFGVVMVLSQLYLPHHVAMASGLNVGLAVGLGGVSAVALGAVADAVDLETALTVCAVAPVVGVVLCLLLPAPRVRVAGEPASAYAPQPQID